MESDIKRLIEEAKNGDKEAFGRIYQEYLTPIYRFIYFRVPNKIEADDLTQEVFLKAFNSLDRFNIQNNSPLAYFYKIARNLLIDNYRKKKTSDINIDLISEAIATEETPQSKAIKQDDVANLKRALEKISENEREVLILKFIDDYKNSEIAEIMQKNEEAVRQLQSRGLKALRELIISKNFNL